MISIYDLSWGKISFLAKLQLFFKSQKCEKQKMRSRDKQLQAQGCSALSSAYYSIVGTAFSQLKATLRPKWLLWFAPVRIAIWSLTWLPLATWCHWQMLPLSDRVVALIGYKGMSADQCDVRQSILRCRGWDDEARKCIRVALTKNLIKAHTRGLLHVGLAKIYQHEGNWYETEKQVRSALAEAVFAEQQDPRQAARIYRHCAALTDVIGQGNLIPGDKLRRRAQALAQATSAEDQLLKL
ncbi:MAG: hypothetical protein Q8Q22_02040 [bacterium]|nr:hypothetical protein [bacterium]